MQQTPSRKSLLAQAAKESNIPSENAARGSRQSEPGDRPNSQSRQRGEQSSRQKAFGGWGQPGQIMLPRHGIFYSATFAKSPGLPKSSMHLLGLYPITPHYSFTCFRA